MTLEEFQEKIKELNADELITRLKDEDSRRTLIQLDREFGGQAQATRAVIDAIPTDVLAAQTNLEKTLNDLLLTNSHPKLLETVTEKIAGFNREQINAQPWLSTWITSQAFSQIVSKNDATQQLNTRLRTATLENSAYEVFGKEIADVNDYDELLQAINESDPQELLATLQDQKKFLELSRLGANFQDSGQLVGAYISRIPAEQWPDGQELIATFNQALATKTPKALEAIVDKVGEFSDEKIARSRDELSTFIYSRNVAEVYGSDELKRRLATTLNESTRDKSVSDFFNTDPKASKGPDNVPGAGKVAMRPADKLPTKDAPSRGIS